MAYFITSLPGAQPLGEFSDVARHTPGTVVRAVDPALGEGMFIYLGLTTAVAVGNGVQLNAYSTAVATLVSTGVRAPVGVAMAVKAGTSAVQYGWAQISGLAAARTSANPVVTGTPVYVTATGGVLDDAVSATNKIDGAEFVSASGVPGANLTYMQLMPGASLNGNG